jgi:DNA (cytosine-5)-methyltransferase 1
VIITSTAYKILFPEQDIRYHQEQLQGGYSGRTFDTRYTTPFLQKHFPHFAMAESAWLTRSLEQPHPYTLDYQGKIRSKNLKSAFLQLLDLLQQDSRQTYPVLVHIFSGLLRVQEAAFRFDMEQLVPAQVPIAEILNAVGRHFAYPYSTRGTARLPVIALYAIYTLLINDVRRYEDKILLPMETHTSADVKSRVPGDIVIANLEGSFYEAVEVKHNKPVDIPLINNVRLKIRDVPLERYYILTTAEPNVAVSVADEVQELIEEIRQTHGCQIIPNGVLPTLKYYLRLVDNPEQFLVAYTEQLQQDYDNATAIKQEHLTVWQMLTEDYFTD